jgi:hypothetical protein
MAIIDLVRKSSGVIIGVVRLEKVFAAYLKARRDAVRFDLKADLGRGVSVPQDCLSLYSSEDFWNTLKSN